MKLLDLYLARVLMGQILVVLAVLAGIFVFVTFIDQVSYLGTGNYSVLDALRYVLLSTPRITYEIFPMAVLIGAILGLSLLAMDSELIVMRSSGVSVGQITSAALKLGLFLALIALLMGEFLTPWTETLAQRGRAQALERNIEHKSNSGLWMRDGNTFVNVREVLPDLSLRDIRVFQFDSTSQLRALVHAGRGYFSYTLDILVPDIGDFDNVDVIEVLVAPGDKVDIESPLITLESDKATMDVPSPVAGTVTEVRIAVGDQVSEGSLVAKVETASWTLDQVKQTLIDEQGFTTVAKGPKARWTTSVTPQTMSVFLVQPDQLSLMQLRKYIAHLITNVQDTRNFELALWSKLNLPLATGVMLLLAIPFVFGSIRTDTMGRNLFIGIMIGIVFFAASKALGYIVLVYRLPPILGATLPTLAFALAAGLLYRRIP